MSFSFVNLNNFVASVHSTIRNVESSIDRAIGAEDTSNTNTNAPHSQQTSVPQTRTTSANSTRTSGPSTKEDSVNQFVRATTGDFFSSFETSYAAPTVTTPPRAANAKKPNISSTSPSSSLSSLPSSSASSSTSSTSSFGWDLSLPSSSLSSGLQKFKSILSQPNSEPSESSSLPLKVETILKHSSAPSTPATPPSPTFEISSLPGSITPSSPHYDRTSSSTFTLAHPPPSSLFASEMALIAEQESERENQEEEERKRNDNGWQHNELEASSHAEESWVQVENKNEPVEEGQTDSESVQYQGEKQQEEEKEKEQERIAQHSPIIEPPTSTVDPSIVSLQHATHHQIPTNHQIESQPQRSKPSTPHQTNDLHPTEVNLPIVPLSLDQSTSSANASLSSPPLSSSSFEPTSSPNSISPEFAALQKRCETAELIGSKLNRLVKIRELQLEKLQLEQSNNVNTIQTLNSQLEAKIHEMVTLKERHDNTVSSLAKGLEEERRHNQELIAERDLLRKLQDNNETSTSLLATKDAQIEAVLKEGQQLMSKAQNYELIIKKLRKEIAEKDNENNNAKSQIQTLQSTVAGLTEQIQTEKEKNKRQESTIADLTSSAEEVSTRANEVVLQMRTMEATAAEQQHLYEQTVLMLKQKEVRIAELENELDSQRRSRTDAMERLESLKVDTVSQSAREESLLRTLEDLQATMKQDENNSQQRLTSLEEELKEVREKLRAADARNEELVTAIPDATRPLLRQIENLQSSMNSSKTTFMTVESQLKTRLSQVEHALLEDKHEKSLLEEKIHTLTLEIAEKDLNINTLRQKLTGFESTLRQMKKRADEEQERATQFQEQLLSSTQMLAERETERDEMLGTIKRQDEKWREKERDWQLQLKEEKGKREKLQLELKERDKLLASTSQANLERERSDRSLARSEQLIGPFSSTSPSSSIPSSNHDFLSSIGGNSTISGGGVGTNTTIDLLRSLLRQKENETSSLRQQISEKERTRQELSEQIVSLTQELQDQALQMSKLPALEAQLRVITMRHDAAVAVIGEKEEQIEELKADLLEVKQVFRHQVGSLIEEVGKLKKENQLSDTTVLGKKERAGEEKKPPGQNGKTQISA